MIAGTALGAFNSMSNVFGSAHGPFTKTPGQGVLWLEYVSAWLGSDWAWAMFAFTVGWLTRRPGPAVFRAVLGLLVAVVAYYSFDWALGMTSTVEISEMVFWSRIALFVAPLMALLGVFARKPNRWSLLAGLTAPILVSYDILTLGGGNGPDHIRPWSQWLVLCAAVGLAVVFVGRAARLEEQRRTPAWALLILLAASGALLGRTTALRTFGPSNLAIFAGAQGLVPVGATTPQGSHGARGHAYITVAGPAGDQLQRIQDFRDRAVDQGWRVVDTVETSNATGFRLRRGDLRAAVDVLHSSASADIDTRVDQGSRRRRSQVGTMGGVALGLAAGLLASRRRLWRAKS